MDQVLRATRAGVAITIYDVDGTPTDPDAHAVTVTIVDSAIYDSNGNPIAGNPMPGSPFTATRLSTGVYQVALAAAQTAQLDEYTATWAFQLGGDAETLVTEFEIVGSFLFSIGELRSAFDGKLADVGDYPTADLVRMRQSVEEHFEHVMNVSWTLRGARELLDGDGSSSILLSHIAPQRIVSGTESGFGSFVGDPNAPFFGSTTPVPYTDAQIADMRLYRTGLVRKMSGATFPNAFGNVTFLLEHGERAPRPVVDAGLLLAKEKLIESPIPRRATSESTEVGIIRYSIAGRDGMTGIPDVDAIVSQFTRNPPNCA